MNIGLVSEGYWPICDGVAVYVTNLFQNLSEKGHNVYIFAPQYPQIDPSSEPKVIRIPSVYSWIVPPYRIPNPWTARKVFRELFHQLGLDVVHSQIPSIMIYPANQVCKELRIPHVITYHTHLERYISHYVPIMPELPAKWLAKIYSHSVCSRSECLIAPSSAIKRILESYEIQTRIEWIPHGIDVETFKNAAGFRIRKEFGIKANDKVLVYAGRLTNEKNIQFLFTVLSLLSRDNSIGRLKMIIVGTGRHEADIKNDCRAMGLDKAVLFTGLVRNRLRLADIYAAGDVFVFASITEVFGLALLEAQACGTPVVAVGAVGVCDSVQDGYGGFLTELDIGKFAERVKRLLLDPELRRQQSRKALDHARQFSLDTMTAKLLKLYVSLVDAK